MAETELALRRAVAADLPAIAAIHRRAYSARHFTSRLPAATLAAYYGLFLANGSEILVLAERDGGPIAGFVVFGRGIGEKIARFRQDQARSILRTSAAHPIAAGGKVLRQVWSRVALGRSLAPAEYLLLSIAVARSGQGVGGLLLDAFLARAALDGARRTGLYVNVDNLGAINAYVKRGFQFRELRGTQFYMERDV